MVKKEKCEEITTEGPSFFQIVTDPRTTDFLIIPSCFAKHIENDAKRTFTLRGSSSGVGTWSVKLEWNKNAKRLVMHEGWKDFHRDNSLKEGEFLLFRYDGSMVFTVRIFKTNSLEREVHKQLMIPCQTLSQGCSKKMKENQVMTLCLRS